MFYSQRQKDEDADAFDGLKASLASLQEEAWAIRKQMDSAARGSALAQIEDKQEQHRIAIELLLQHLGLEVKKNPGKPERVIPGVDPFYEIVKTKH